MVGEVDPTLKVSDEAFAYLKLQKGRLEPLAGDRKAWQMAYEHDLLTAYQEMRPYLPPACWALLDIGSGLGGIDVLLSRHYGAPFVNLLDGEDDPPELKLHRETFSSKQVAIAFQRANGVRSDRLFYYGPSATAAELCKPYDLVLSLGSWCFHYEPNEYLPRLLAGGGLHMDTRVIVDVRKDKPGWIGQLAAAGLTPVGLIRDEKKYRRLCLRRV